MKKYLILMSGILSAVSVISFLSQSHAKNANIAPRKPAISGTVSYPGGSIKENTGDRIVSSKIEKVIVYSDRAMVTRTAKIELEAGEQSLLFGNIPYEIDPNSVQVQGAGDAILKDIQIKPVYFAEVQGQEEKKLYSRKQEIEDTLREITDKLNQAKNEKKFIEGISAKLTSNNEKSAAAELNPEKWESMVRFYRNRQEALDKEIRETEKSVRNVKNQLNQINREIAHAGQKQNKSKYNVQALVQMKTRGALTLHLSYIIHNTSWRPVYDLRVSTDKRRLYVAYNAIVWQNTAENWDDVKLELSTARPNIGGQHPELMPWRINRFIPSPYSNALSARSEKKKDSMEQMMKMAPATTGDAEEADGAKEAAAEPDLAAENAAVSSQTTSVVFRIPGLNSVTGNHAEHKVTVMLQEFDVDFRYSAVPKLTPFAYLKAKAVNQTEYPLLAGSTNIFLNNNFVANGRLQTIAPGEEFWTFLGIDEGIKVEHKLLKKDVSTDGLFSKTNKVTYSFLIQVTSNKKHEEEIVVWDQLPISGSQDIRVELIEPVYQKDTNVLKKNELEYLEWLYRIKPGEKIKLPLKFSVSYPADYKVTGLE